MLDDWQDTLDNLRRNGPELRRRSEHSASDGYPSSSMRSDGGGGSGESSPTESAALARPMADPTGQQIERVFQMLSDIHKRCSSIDNLVGNIANIEVETRGRQSAVESCDACTATVTGVGNDRRRDGFCDNCYRPWLRFKESCSRVGQDASRVVFIAQRRAFLEAKQRDPVAS
jgi:hypothetical protein